MGVALVQKCTLRRHGELEMHFMKYFRAQYLKTTAKFCVVFMQEVLYFLCNIRIIYQN